MTEMIERVAKAIYGKLGPHGELDAEGSGDLGLAVLIARAAIEAMREPTDAMMTAYMQVWNDATPDDATQACHALIDAALKDKKEKP